MKKIFLLAQIIIMLIQYDMSAQQDKTGFSSLSKAEKWWVFFHPFKAKRALSASMESLEVTDSIKSTGEIGTDNNGGKLDAFKHTYWMAILSKEIGPMAAFKLGKAHEKGNHQAFLKGNKEDGFLPDKVSSEMDLFNNQVGVDIFQSYPKDSKSQYVQYVLHHLANGDLRMIKKHGSNFIDCDGKVLEPSDLKGNWENDKCLIPSTKV